MSRPSLPFRAASMLLVGTVAAAGSLQEPEAAIDTAIARAAFDQVRALAAADAGELWGIPLDFPLLFVDPETREVVADRADQAGLLSARDGAWTGRFPADRGIANFATEWAGLRWTMLVWPPPADEVGRARLLMHESFHNAQPELEISAASSQPCAHLATFDGRLWLRLEARALAAALEADGEDGQREAAAADALLFRALRRSLFPAAAAAEDGLERIEGSAEYTGVRLCTGDERVRSALTVATLRGLAARPTLGRSFQYGTGPALGLLLDGYDPFWREGFLAGETLSDLLTPAVWFERPADLEGEARRRALDYGFDQVVAAEKEREAERERRLAAYRVRFLDGPVLILPASSPQTSFDPSRIDLLAGVGSVYGTLWLSDDWGVADAPGGALIRSDLSVHLAAPSDVEGPELAGDGWTLALSRGWSVVAGERSGDYRVVRDGG